jgi:carbonic anhydrase
MRYIRMFCFVVVAISLFVSPMANAFAAAPCPSDSKAKLPEADPGDLPCMPRFTYARQDLWGGECRTGHVQSPIVIRNAVPEQLQVLDFRGYQSGTPIIVNDCNHHMIEVFVAAGSTLNYAGHTYKLVRFHFHEPAENTINGGQPQAMEIHLVHEAVDDPKLGLVVAVLVRRGGENDLITTLWRHIPARGIRANPDITINAGGLLPEKKGYYTFQGSLTTPDCTEGITWIVFKDAITFSPNQVLQYKEHYRGTARRSQPVNREIKQSRD